MTVSPNRPQDGNLPPKVGGSGAEPNDHSSLASLPPTLFRLPNLAVSKPIARKPIARGDVDRDAVETEPLQSNPALQDESGVGKRADTWSSDETTVRAAADTLFHGVSDEQCSRRSDTPPLTFEDESRTGESKNVGLEVTHQDVMQVETKAMPADSSSDFVDPFRPLEMTPGSAPVEMPSGSTPPSDTAAPKSSRPPIPDVPAGRSWMESLGSHGVVIVLLLVVVAAALLTGKGEDDPTATSLSTQSELLNFDELTADLPLPTHEHDMGQLENASSQIVDTTAESMQGATSTQVATTEAPDVASAVTPPQIDNSQEVVASQPASNVNTEAVASLKNPLPVQVQTAVPASGEALAADGVQTNQFFVPDSGVNAMPVSDRSANTANTEASLPSLEELAGLQNQQSNQQPAKANAATRILTKTPVGISDWSKYLPPLNATVEPDAGTASFNN
jgi:hypothetical protein